MFGNVLDPIDPEVEGMVCLVLHLKGNQVEVEIGEHHRRRPQPVGDPFPVHPVILDGDFLLLSDADD